MIGYSPVTGETPGDQPLKVRPKTCFLMTKLGGEIPKGLTDLRRRVISRLKKQGIQFIDANSYVTGADFLEKIWRMIVSVPFGVAILHEEMDQKTVGNIFYELGMMDALGKRTIVVKTKKAKVPSDFVRTEYINGDGNFYVRFDAFLKRVLEEEIHFRNLSAWLKKDPLLAVDYLRRAYLISGDKKNLNEALELISSSQFTDTIKASIARLICEDSDQFSSSDDLSDEEIIARITEKAKQIASDYGLNL